MIKKFTVIIFINLLTVLNAHENINLKPVITQNIKNYGQKNHTKNIVFIEPCLSSHILIIEARKEGYNPIIISASSDKRTLPENVLKLSSLHFKIDTNDDERVLNFVKELKKFVVIDAIIPGAEFYVPLTAKVANALKLRGLNPDVALKARRKDLMREALSKAHVNIPKFKLVKNTQQLISAVHEIGLPCVIKATDLAGSVNVSKAENLEEAISYFNNIIDNPNQSAEWGGRHLQKQALVEEYIQGKEYSVEGFIKDNKVYVVSITEKLLSCEKDFVEVGHIVNSPISDEQSASIKAYVQQVADALKLSIGPFHAELRLTEKGPILMEIAMRLAGDYIPKVINYAYGINYYVNTIKLMSGDLLDLNATKQIPTGITFFYRPNLLFMGNTEPFNSLLQDSNVLETKAYYKTGQEIPKKPMEKHKLGYAIVQNPNYEKLKDKIKEIETKTIWN